jgi:phosphatidate cytidylyltransferase
VSNLLQRLLLFFIGVPAVIALIILLPQFNHLAAVVVIEVFAAGCSLELAQLFSTRGIPAPRPLFAAFGALPPLGAYIGSLPPSASPLGGACTGLLIVSGALILFSFSRFAFSHEAAIPSIIHGASALAFAYVYPGLLGAFIVLIAAEPRFATESLLCFSILAFSGDSAAWFFGITLGKHRGVAPVSPNKSIEGFAGALFGSTLMAFACAYFFPQAIPARWWELAILGLVTGSAVIIGDLFESSIKRSAGTKDSGTAVPGRGGFLDSFDSLLFAAPVFYGLTFLFGFFR